MQQLQETIQTWELSDTLALPFYLETFTDTKAYWENRLLVMEFDLPNGNLPIGDFDRYMPVIHSFEYVNGHYTVRFDPTKLGFERTGDYCRRLGVHRQNIYNRRDKFEFVNESYGKRWIREIKK